MLDKDKIEKSLLLGVILQKNWEVLLRNNITRSCFSVANYRLYDYIKGFTDDGNYPDIRITTNEFNIDEVMFNEYKEITNLDELCSVLHAEYVKNQVELKVNENAEAGAYTIKITNFEASNAVENIKTDDKEAPITVKQVNENSENNSEENTENNNQNNETNEEENTNDKQNSSETTTQNASITEQKKNSEKHQTV